MKISLLSLSVCLTLTSGHNVRVGPIEPVEREGGNHHAHEANNLRGGTYEYEANNLRGDTYEGEIQTKQHAGNQGRTNHRSHHNGPEGRLGHQHVLIIGAGAAGLTAAHFLDYDGWEYKILEASSSTGGRTREGNKWRDPYEDYYNIDYGAQYIHTTTSKPEGQHYKSAKDLLQTMVKHPLSDDYNSKYTKVEATKAYVIDDAGVQMDYHKPPEYRWAGGAGWHSFLMEEVAFDTVQDNVMHHHRVTEIDYSSSTGTVKVTCDTKDGHKTFTADHVIVTVPMSVLQKKTDFSITFKPELSDDKKEAIKDGFAMANGFKIWLEFDKKWWGDKKYFLLDDDVETYNVEVDSVHTAKDGGYRLFWDEMYPYPDATKNILGGLIYGNPAEEYKGKSDEEIKNDIVELLRPSFSKHGVEFNKDDEYVVVNWSTEPFIQTAYTIFADTDYQDIMMKPSPSETDPRILFAGEALNHDSWGFVHGAGITGKTQAEKLIELRRRH